MRTTDGKPALELRTEGDASLAEAAAEALRAPGRADRLTHGFHTYPAGLHPDAARTLLSALPGRRVLDPFCGGGTVLVEGLVAGREVHGRDLGVIALLVARARTSTASEEVLTEVRGTARRLTEAARTGRARLPDDLFHLVRGWYEPHVLVELEILRRGIVEVEVSDEARELLWAVFSSMLVKASHQRSDTSPERAPRHRPPGTTAVLFHKKARELGRRIAELREAVPEGTPSADVARGDAREPAGVGEVDLILTSPPYPGVYDYLPMQRLREAWLAVRSPRAQEIGSRRTFERDPRGARRSWLADTGAWVGASASQLATGGRLVVVVGDGLVDDGPVDTEQPTLACADAAGLSFVASAHAARPDHARRSIRWEHALVFERR